MSNKLLLKDFYKKPTLEVAENLLGCFLVRKIGQKIIRARVIEVEAYIGEDDLACHARVGKTKRTEVMYGEAGHAYVYLIYGMYYCLNVVTEKVGFPAAILIRSVEIKGEPVKVANGPGKLSRFLEIDKTFNNYDLTLGEKLWIESPTVRLKQDEKIEKGKRINIDYAKEAQEYLWRFKITDLL